MIFSRYFLVLPFVLAATTRVHALTFSDWRAASFTPAQLADATISAATADPDADGAVNLQEYVFAGTPLTAETALQPRLELIAGTLALTYRERHGLADASIRLQGSDTLLNWITYNSVTEADRVAHPGYDEVTLLDPAPYPGTRRFLRLRLELLPVPALRAPSQLALTPLTPTRWTVSWTDPNTTETGYRIERQLPGDSSWEPVGTTPPDTGEFVDTAAGYQVGCTYRVIAFDAAGNVAISAPVTLPDSDRNTLPDPWEQYYFGQIGIDPDADANGNGVSNRDEYLEGTDPTLDFYEGVAPLLTVVQGNRQSPIPGEFLRQPWKVLVRHPDGSPWAGAPVRFTATADEGLLAAQPDETARLAPALTVNADAGGYAQVWLQCR